MRRRPVLVAVLAVALAGGATSVADASVYCVATSVSPACLPAADLATALNNASVHSGPDDVLLGSGTFSAPAGFSYTGSGSNPVTIQGAGSSTVLTDASTTANAPVLKLGIGSSVSSLRITLPTTGSSIGLSLDGATATGVAVDDASVNTFAEVGVLLSGAFPRFSSGTIALSATGGPSRVGIDGEPTSTIATIEDSSVSVLSNVTTYAVDVGSQTGLVVVRRCTLTASDPVISATAAVTTVDDSVLRVSPVGQAIGLYALQGSIVARNDTVIAPPGTEGLDVRSVGSAHASASVEDSIISGSIMRAAQPTSTSDLRIRYSDYDFTQLLDSGPGILDLGTTPTLPSTGHNVNVDPGFVSATDAHLAATSALIDAGDPSALLPDESSTAIDGAARVLDGNGDGVAIRDIGAYERPVPPPVVVAPPTPIAPAPVPILPVPKPAPPAIRLRSHTLTISRTTGKGTLQASCTAPKGDRCTVTGTVTGTLPAAKKHPRAATKPVTLATIKGTISAGATGKLAISLTKAARAAALKGTLHAKLAVTVSDRAGGRAKLASQTLTVKAAAKPKRRHRAAR